MRYQQKSEAKKKKVTWTNFGEQDSYRCLICPRRRDIDIILRLLTWSRMLALVKDRLRIGRNEVGYTRSHSTSKELLRIGNHPLYQWLYYRDGICIGVSGK